MPIYDYKCRDCGRVSEILVRGEGSKEVRCAGCGSGNMERLINSSYMIRMNAPAPGTTCCGNTERCDSPPCSSGGACHRNH